MIFFHTYFHRYSLYTCLSCWCCNFVNSINSGHLCNSGSCIVQMVLSLSALLRFFYLLKAILLLYFIVLWPNHCLSSSHDLCIIILLTCIEFCFFIYFFIMYNSLIHIHCFYVFKNINKIIIHVNVYFLFI